MLTSLATHEHNSVSLQEPRRLFIYGTLCAKPLLAWALTGDASNIDAISRLALPARVSGFARYAVKNCDYPAVVKHNDPHSAVDGYLLHFETASQRKKLDNFEGELYKNTIVTARLLDNSGKEYGEAIEADMYLWDGDMDALSPQPWELSTFVAERLEDWIDLFAGMELVGDE